jgi:small conductance mechanosensitive channel
MQQDVFHALARWWNELDSLVVAGLRIVVILVLAWLTIAIAQRGIQALRAKISTRLEDRQAVQRAQTLGRAFRYLVAVIVWLVAGMLVLSVLGVSIAPVLGAAGVAGLALGFGAQNLVKDYFTGFFLLLEDQIRQGEVVKLGDHSGEVEEITLRFVRLRDDDGNVHFIPNGTISAVINMSRNHAQAILEVSVDYREDLDRVMKLMRDVAAEMRADPEHAGRIVDDLHMDGVERWIDATIVIRARIRVVALEQDAVRRAFLQRLKNAFELHDIVIPCPRLTVHMDAGATSSGTAAL